jgi:hypothetical protein
MEADQGELEANQEKIEGVKAMHVLTTLHSQAYDVLHGACKGVTYEKVTV